MTINPEPLEGRIGLHSDASDPDSVMQSELPQLPIEEWDRPPGFALGKITGKMRNMGNTPLEQGSGDLTIFAQPKQTQFVRVQFEDGMERMEKYDPQRHGPLNDIPDTGLLPGELLEQLSGFGVELVDQGQQFQRVRKSRGGASKLHWPPGHHPRPRKLR